VLLHSRILIVKHSKKCLVDPCLSNMDEPIHWV